MRSELPYSPELSAPLSTPDTTHVHAITARAAADAAQPQLNLLNPMYKHMRADLYEIGIAYSDLGCCDNSSAC